MLTHVCPRICGQRTDPARTRVPRPQSTVPKRVYTREPRPPFFFVSCSCPLFAFLLVLSHSVSCFLLLSVADLPSSAPSRTLFQTIKLHSVNKKHPLSLHVSAAISHAEPSLVVEEARRKHRSIVQRILLTAALAHLQDVGHGVRYAVVCCQHVF